METVPIEDIRFIQENDGKIGVGHCPDKDAGGFEVIAWLPSSMLDEALRKERETLASAINKFAPDIADELRRRHEDAANALDEFLAFLRTD